MTLNETFNLLQCKVNGDLGAFQITIPSSKNTLVCVESTEDQPRQTHRLYLHYTMAMVCLLKRSLLPLTEI